MIRIVVSGRREGSVTAVVDVVCKAGGRYDYKCSREIEVETGGLRVVGVYQFWSGDRAGQLQCYGGRSKV